MNKILKEVDCSLFTLEVKKPNLIPFEEFFLSFIVLKNPRGCFFIYFGIAKLLILRIESFKMDKEP